MNFQTRMKYVKIILLDLQTRSRRWNEIEKRMIELSGSHSKFTSTMRWLIDNEYIIKMGAKGSRKPYRINTDKVTFNDNGLVVIKI